MRVQLIDVYGPATRGMVTATGFTIGAFLRRVTGMTSNKPSQD